MFSITRSKTIQPKIGKGAVHLGRESISERHSRYKFTSRSERCFSLRIGDFRIIYEVVDNELIFYVIAVGSRWDIYK
ncbi:type II toxin-antitoxin system RelE/ParE family toxin [Sutcliffiella horikoshii]|uniref:type II toxin-antitoxin system RelE family toxin n=1 Tax=Sutcliffiella horikoshii TaxID=79883 RepID=UPI00384E3A2D